MDYVSIHNHTKFSLLDGLTSPEDLVMAAKALGHGAVGITDHGSISGLIQFYKAAVKHEIKPILGIEAYYCDDTQKTKGEKTYHIILIAKSNKGLKSLFKLMSRAHRDGFYYKPRIDLDMLYDSEDLICSTACLGGILAHPNYEKVVEQLHDYFEDDFYLELMPIDLEPQYEVNRRAVELSQELGIKLIATADTHYLKPEDHRLHNFLLNLNTKGGMEFEVTGLYLKSHEEMVRSFCNMGQMVDNPIIEEALANTLEIAEKCDVDWPESSISLPRITKEDPEVVLRRLLEEGIKTVYPYGFRHQERLEYEIGIIKEKGFIDYFLLVEDFVRWARSVDMELGCGRGSAGGSIICNILGITDIDPMEENLLFERFLNPERTDYPDIDLDIPQSRRHEAIEYLKEKYGEERVSYISTVSELKIKAAFKDVARKLGIPFFAANRISDSLEEDVTLEEFAKENEEFKALRKTVSPEVINDLIYYTDGIRGTLRHESRHAAGIVIAPNRIDDYGVLERRKDEYSINWSMNDVSYQGLVKIDALGLRTLDIIAGTLKLIKKRHGVDIDWRKVHLNDSEILKEFELGHTAGIFQFESGQMTRLVKRLSPIIDKSILVDCNALVRPGPADSGMTEAYIKRHTGQSEEQPEVYMPWLLDGPGAEIAKDTYQVIIYQEQVIEVLRRLAGYTIPQADTIRRIFAKKKGDFEEHREDFLRGVAETVGMPPDVGSVLFNNLETFSRYGFNKSHAAAYTELGLRQMYLKVNYPLEYMTSLFMFTPEDDKKLKFTDECRRMGIQLKSPDINLSDDNFTIDDDGIRIGLSAIKGLGPKAVECIRKQRKSKKFKSLIDFRLRLPKNQVNKRIVKHLILSGAFDSMGVNHRLWAEELLERLNDGEDITKLQTHDTCEDYPEETKEMNKQALLPGIWKINVKPEVGLNIDAEALEELRQIIGACKSCILEKPYHVSVAFEYTERSDIMVVCEAPGEDEVAQGRPLIGKAGDELILKKMSRVGIRRSDCFLTNVYKHRPLENKLPPAKSCPHDCWEILTREIEILQPRFILALGNRAREFFCGESSGIQAAADKYACEVEIVGNRPIPVLYSVHPSSVFYGDGAENHERLDGALRIVKSIVDGDYEG